MASVAKTRRGGRSWIIRCCQILIAEGCVGFALILEKGSEAIITVARFRASPHHKQGSKQGNGIETHIESSQMACDELAGDRRYQVKTGRGGKPGNLYAVRAFGSFRLPMPASYEQHMFALDLPNGLRVGCWIIDRIVRERTILVL